MQLYGHPCSGNVYKPQLLMGLLGMEYEHTPTDWDGGTDDPAFRAINPNGKVPALVDGDFILWESNAILQYLAHDSPFWPKGREAQAQVLQWMFFEQYSHEPYVAIMRAIMHFRAPGPDRDAAVEAKRAGAEHALSVMEGHLRDRNWFVGDGPSIADIALFAYTHVAEEGTLSLEPYPAVQAWIRRVEAIEGFVPMAPFAYP